MRYDICVIDPEAYKSQSVYLAVSKVDGQCDYILLTEGTGDNLLYEDKEDGYVNYINITPGKFAEDEFIDGDDGMMYMSKTYIRDHEEGIVYFVKEENLLREVYDDLSSIKSIYIFAA